jgi:hypothetical protein
VTGPDEESAFHEVEQWLMGSDTTSEPRGMTRVRSRSGGAGCPGGRQGAGSPDGAEGCVRGRGATAGAREREGGTVPWGKTVSKTVWVPDKVINLVVG